MVVSSFFHNYYYLLRVGSEQLLPPHHVCYQVIQRQMLEQPGDHTACLHLYAQGLP